MKVDVDTTLKHIDGNDLPLTLKKACIEALMAQTQDDRASGEVKFKRYELAVKVNSGATVDISPEEAAMLKDLIGKVYGPGVVGPAYKLLNG